MAYTSKRHEVQLTREDREAILARILDTTPAEGRVLTGYVGGDIPVALSANQRAAYHEAAQRELRRKRRAGVAA